MVRTLRVLIVFVAAVTCFITLLMPKQAATLPLFARKYQFQCTQCHVAFPRLNAFGMKFRQNGYRLEGAKGESPWESTQFPFSLIGNVGIQYLKTDTLSALGPPGHREQTSTLHFVQNSVEFHSAGTLAPEISFRFDNEFTGPGGVLESGMAFVQFDDIAKNGAVNLKAGIFDAEVPFLADSRKTTNAGYLSPTTLDGEGVELNGTKSGWTYAAGLVNSERTVGKPNAKSLNNLENTYAWLMRDINGQLVTGRVFLDRQDPRKTNANSSLHLIAQGSAFLNKGPWILIPGYTYESFADEPDTVGPGLGTLAVQTGLLEGLWLLGPDTKWVLSGRYEIRHVPESKVNAVKGDDILFAANLAYYLNPNARVCLDWTHTASKLHTLIEDNPLEPKQDEVQLFTHVGF